jgi:hypothetical protein
MKTSHFTAPLLKVTCTNYNLLIKELATDDQMKGKGIIGKVAGGILCKRLKLTDMYSAKISQ